LYIIGSDTTSSKYTRDFKIKFESIEGNLTEVNDMFGNITDVKILE
jgi:hypothetical protein